VWGFATLRHDPGQELLEAVAAATVRQLSDFTSQNLSNTVWAYQQLGYQPSRELLEVIIMITCREYAGNVQGTFREHSENFASQN